MIVKNKKVIIAAGKEEVQRKDVIDTLRCMASVKNALLSKGFSVETLFLEKKDFADINITKENILDLNPYCIFNLFEGFSDDPHKEAEFVKVLEDIQVSFTGNSSYTLSLCLDKGKVKQLLKQHDIPTPRGFFITDVKDLESNNLCFPLFIKPRFEDASVGINRDSLATRKEELWKSVEKKLREFPSGLLVEEFISGEEYNIGFLGDFPYELVGISVLDYSQYERLPPFLTYDSKWETDSQDFKMLTPSLERKIDESLRRRIIDLSKKAGHIVKCKGYFRMDLRERKGELFFLEVNPNPDINEDSGFMRQAYFKGYRYEDMVEKICCNKIQKHI